MKRFKIPVFAFVLSAAAAVGALAGNTEIKLNSNDGSTKFIVQDNNAETVFQADSDGNTYAVGYSSANKFYGDGSTLTNVSTHTFKIGDSYGGGKIFWLDAKAGQMLIVAPDELGPVQWGPAIVTGATLVDIYGGRANTLMISTVSSAPSAARLCAAYTKTVDGVYYDDWYLPSKNELYQLWSSQVYPSSDYFWSSSEYNTGSAWDVLFSNGGMYSSSKTSGDSVRCVRGGPGLGNLPTHAETVTGGAYLSSTQTFTGANTFNEITLASATITGPARIARSSTTAADAGITLTSADFGKTITVNSGSPQSITLPAVTAADIGATITVIKLGAGRVTVYAATGDTIEDSSASGSIYSSPAGQVYASVTLRLVTETKWSLVDCVGAWITQ